MKKNFLLLIILLSGFYIQSQEKNIYLDEIIISDKSKIQFINKEIIIDSFQINTPRTVGDVFKNIQGFNITKRSNYAIEPNN
jgi:hypothetical protein